MIKLTALGRDVSAEVFRAMALSERGGGDDTNYNNNDSDDEKKSAREGEDESIDLQQEEAKSDQAVKTSDMEGSNNCGTSSLCYLCVPSHIL